MKYLDNAPRALIRLHNHPNSFRHKALLGRLLCDSNMQEAWQNVSDHINIKLGEPKPLLKKTASVCKVKKQQLKMTNPPLGNNASAILESKTLEKGIFSRSFEKAVKLNMCQTMEYTALWRAITYSITKSRSTNQPRRDKSNHFIRIAQLAEELSSAIAEGPLDCLIYAFFPSDIAKRIFKENRWSALAIDERFHIASGIIHDESWPSLTDVLEELAMQAGRESSKAKYEKRYAVNNTQDREANHFIQSLNSYLRPHLGERTRQTLAAIASVVFNTPIDGDFVKRALRHSGLTS